MLITKYHFITLLTFIICATYYKFPLKSHGEKLALQSWVFLSPIYEYMGDKKKLASEIGMNREYKPLVSLITFLLQKEI